MKQLSCVAWIPRLIFLFFRFLLSVFYMFALSFITLKYLIRIEWKDFHIFSLNAALFIRIPLFHLYFSFLNFGFFLYFEYLSVLIQLLLLSKIDFIA